MAEHESAEEPLPRLPGFREMAQRRRRLVAELAQRRRQLGLSQTQLAARMGTSQSAVARLESQAGDVRLSTLERYAAALGQQLQWGLSDDQTGDSR
jgi:transcriptional regulator with XRE-family HTH domain